MKKYNLIINILCCAFVCAFVSCDDNLAESDPEQAVVEGYLYPGNTAEVKINQQYIYALNDTTFEKPISGLNVLLSNLTTGNDEILREDEPGVYLSNNKIADEGTYRLSFSYAGKDIWAETTIPDYIINYQADDTELVHTERFSEDTIRYVNFTWDNPELDYYMVYMYHNASWTTPVYNNSPSKSITSNPSQDSIKTVNSQGFGYYGPYNIVLFRLNQEYVDLYYSSSANSQYMGNPPSNVNNGFGIFTAMRSDTLSLVIK